MARSARRRLLVVVLLVAAAGWSAAVVLSLASAVEHARDGADAIDAVRDLDPDSLDDLIEPLERAGASFAQARDRAGSTLVAPARVLPWLGRQIRGFHALANAATGAATIGVEAAREADGLVSEPLDSGRARLATIRSLASIAARARDGIAALDLGPGENLAGPLAAQREDLAAELDELHHTLETAALSLRVFADLIDGPRTIVVLGANNAEMRAGAGMFLTLGTLRARGGRMDLGGARSVTDAQPPPGRVRPDGDLGDRWGWLSPGDDWRNLMLSPRFAPNAALGLRMWRAGGGARAADAMIALDPVALRGLLGVTGPVRSGGRMIDSDNVLDELLRRQYLRFAGRPNELRRAALGTIAEDVFDALNERSLDPLVLFDALADAARGRHLMAWSARPAEQRAFERMGVDGALREDSMMLSILNRGGNKLDPFLEVRARLTITPNAGGAEGELTITIRNRAPDGLPAYVAGPRPTHGASEGEYVGIVSVNLPGFTDGARIADVRRPLALGADGPTRVVATDVSVPRGARRTVRVLFRLPDPAGSLVVEPGARSPATDWSFRDAEWRDVRPQVLDW